MLIFPQGLFDKIREKIMESNQFTISYVYYNIEIQNIFLTGSPNQC